MVLVPTSVGELVSFVSFEGVNGEFCWIDCPPPLVHGHKTVRERAVLGVFVDNPVCPVCLFFVF